MRRTLSPRKLLTVSLGVAAVAYGACDQAYSSGNLMAPPPCASDADCLSYGYGPQSVCTAGQCITPQPGFDAGPNCTIVCGFPTGDGGTECVLECQQDAAVVDAVADVIVDAAADASTLTCPDGSAGDACAPVDAGADAALDGGADAGDAAIDAPGDAAGD